MPKDLYNDTAHADLKRLVALHPGAHEMLKTAEFEDDPGLIPETAFAWGSRRLYPVHTAEHAVVSALYAREDPTVPPHVRAKIAEALEAYAVPEEVLRKHEVKVASAPGDFLFPEEETYPVRDAGEVKTAEARMMEEAWKLPLERRVEVFHKLATAADRHGVTLGPVAQGWGLASFSAPEKVLEGVTARAFLVKDAEAKVPYEVICASIRSDPGALRDHASRVKLASTLLNLDKRSGIEALWNKRVPDPVLTVFNRPAKVGAQMVVLGPESYDIQSLAGLPSTFWSDALGPEVVGEIAPGGQVNPDRLMDILPTLPAPMMQSLTQSLHAAGVRPTGV